MCFINRPQKYICFLPRSVTIQFLGLCYLGLQLLAQRIRTRTFIDYRESLPVQPLRTALHRHLQCHLTRAVRHHIATPCYCITMSQCLSARLHAVGLEVCRAFLPVVLSSVRHPEVDFRQIRHSRLHGVRCRHGESRSSIRAVLTIQRVESYVVRSDRQVNRLNQRTDRMVCLEFCPTECRTAFVPSVSRTAAYHVGIHQQERHIHRGRDVGIHRLEQLARSLREFRCCHIRSTIYLVSFCQRILVLTRFPAISQHLVDIVQLTLCLVDRIVAVRHRSLLDERPRGFALSVLQGQRTAVGPCYVEVGIDGRVVQHIHMAALSRLGERVLRIRRTVHPHLVGRTRRTRDIIRRVTRQSDAHRSVARHHRRTAVRSRLARISVRQTCGTCLHVTRHAIHYEGIRLHIQQIAHSYRFHRTEILSRNSRSLPYLSRHNREGRQQQSCHTHDDTFSCLHIFPIF